MKDQDKLPRILFSSLTTSEKLVLVAIATLGADSQSEVLAFTCGLSVADTDKVISNLVVNDVIHHESLPLLLMNWELIDQLSDDDEEMDVIMTSNDGFSYILGAVVEKYGMGGEAHGF